MVTNLSDPDGALHVFGVRLIGATPENARKLLLTIAFILAVLLLGWILRTLISAVCRAPTGAAFWGRQIVNLLLVVLLLFGVLSIWFDDPNRLATAAGL